MTKRRRPWALMGLVGLGGLLMMGARRPEDDEEDAGGGGSGDSGGPGSGGSGGGGTGSGGGSGGSGGSGSGGSADDDHPYGDLPPPPEPFPDPEDDDPPVWTGKHLGGKGKGGNGKPRPRPKPGTTDGPKPPIDTPDDDEDDDLDDPEDDDPSRVPPEPEEDDPPPREPPWEDLVVAYPRGGVFYPVVQDDRFGGTSSTRSIAYRYLLSEAYAAALEEGELVHDEAVAWALAVAKQDKLRLRVIDLIQCSGWNDAMYGTEPVRQSHASQHGRSIRLWPVHGPTAELLSEGLTPFRNVRMNGNPGDPDFRHFEILWMPAIDRAVLWESGGQAITTTGMVWDDGTSMENPPPWVMALGIADRSGALAGSFGCPGADGELEVT